MRHKPLASGPNRHMVVPLRGPQPIFVCGVEAVDSVHATQLYAAHRDGAQAGYAYARAHREADERDRLARLQAHLDGGGTHRSWLEALHGLSPST
jgi:hypothetical protein